MSHHLIALIFAAGCAVFCMFVGYIWGKSKGHSIEGSPFGVWLGGAMSTFIGGFVEAAPIGSTSGAGLAGVSGHLHADLTMKHIALEAAFLLSAPVLAGIAELRTYIKSSPFPNVFLPGSPASIAPSPQKLPSP